ncbi:MAG: hypothetical protein JKY43_03215 [Phycisphaerales bacterium]|nr:hypothetical protein [Phycisphaerales bacterium]
MKTFKDLEFKPHSIGNGLQVVMNFDNNYGVSVVKFNGSYGFNSDLWEVAILYKEALTYNTDITDDVLGYQTDQDVTDIMKKVQMLKD